MSTTQIIYGYYLLLTVTLVMVLVKAIRVPWKLGKLQYRVFAITNKLTVGMFSVWSIFVMYQIFPLMIQFPLRHYIRPELLTVQELSVHGLIVMGMISVVGCIFIIIKAFYDGDIREKGIYIGNKLVYWHDITAFNQADETWITLYSSKFKSIFKDGDLEWLMNKRDIQPVLILLKQNVAEAK